MSRRYLTAQSGLWLAASTPLAILGAVLFGVFCWMWISDPQADWFNLIPAGLLSFLLIVPTIVAFFKREYLQVDLENRDAAFFSKGREQWRCGLDELGALGIRRGYRERGVRRTAGDPIGGTTYFHVFCSGRPGLALLETYDYAKASRWAEAVAREWKTGFATMDGKYRGPDQPDQMRQEKSSGAKEVKLSPASGITISTEDGVTTIRSARVRRFGETPNWLFLGGVVLGGMALREVGVLDVIADPGMDPGRTTMAVIASLLAAGFGLRFGVEVFHSLNSANVITIDATHVRHRGQAIPLANVHEVTYVQGPLIVGKKKRIEISADFCATKESPAFVAELRRLIIRGVEAGYPS